MKEATKKRKAIFDERGQEHILHALDNSSNIDFFAEEDIKFFVVGDVNGFPKYYDQQGEGGDDPYYFDTYEEAKWIAKDWGRIETINVLDEDEKESYEFFVKSITPKSNIGNL